MFEVFGKTDRGLRREANEDAFLIADLSESSALDDENRVRQIAEDHELLCVVSDGMGGAKAGEVASQLSIEALFQSFTRGGRRRANDHERRLDGHIRDANDAVYRRSATDADCQGMGTTMTALWVRGQSCYLGHVGDSRAYLLHEGRLRQLTRDHSLVNFFIDQGGMTKKQAESLAERHYILEALGVKKDVSIDTVSVPFHRGDLILVCSDGLYSTMTDEEIAGFMATPGDLAEMGNRMVDCANDRGGPDNITVVLCRLAD